jgi:diguanylate cyclase (GGDEF)-like protein
MFIIALIGLILMIGFLIYRCQIKQMLYRNLYEMESVFQEEPSFVKLTKGIIAVLLPLVKASGGILFWQDNVQSDLKIRTVKGIPAEKIHTALRYLKEPGGLVEQAFNEGHSIDRISTSDDLLTIAKTWLAAPIRSRGKVSGVLVLLKKNGKFSITQQQLITQFSDRCGIQLENALNHEMAIDSARENARLYLNLSRLYQQATRDELTGLYNRAFSIQRLREEANKSWRYGQDLSLIFMDLDHFKNINDTYGHATGDKVLSEVSRVILEQIREYDIPCRFGGEEFVLVLPQTGIDGARELAMRIRRVLSELTIGVEALKITASFGVASLSPGDGRAITHHEQGESWFQLCLEELLARADAAMYVAKEKGRNRVEMAPPLDPISLQSICITP